jgi:hypothetical protein
MEVTRRAGRQQRNCFGLPVAGRGVAGRRQSAGRRGNRAGIAGRPLTWRTFVFAYSLFAVMVTITDVQRATEGFVRLNDSNLRATIFDMEQALATRD